MNCPRCNVELSAPTREPWRHDALPWAVLDGIEVRSCPRCGERATAIPSIEQLHRELVALVARRACRSGPVEIRFLFSYLDWSPSDASRLLGADRATVSRWTSLRRAQPIGPSADRLLRLAAARELDVSLDEIATAVDSEATAPAEVRLSFRKRWVVL